MLGETTIAGIAGDSVTLELTADTTLLTAAGRAARVDVSATGPSGNTAVRGASLDSLTHGVVVYRFLGGTLQAPDTVHVVYTLPRVFGAVSAREPARLTQHLSPSETILAWSAPWATAASTRLASLSSASMPTCTIGAPGTACGVVVDIRPYAPAAVWGAFQSNPGTGQSYGITITFSKPVSAVTITVLRAQRSPARTGRPGAPAPASRSPRTTKAPCTKTSTIPTDGWPGASNVARSATRSGSKMVKSASAPT